MAFTTQIQPRQRIAFALVVLGVHAALIAVLVSGFGVEIVQQMRSEPTITTIDIQPPPPPPPPAREDKTAETRAPEGAAAPKNITSRATEVFAPPPPIPLPRKTVIVAAPDPMLGSDASTGAADEKGPGTGAGGLGTGTGSGGQGDGTGGGNRIADAKYLSGAIRERDYPKGLPRVPGTVETVIVRYNVLPSGRVSGCKVTQSSGNPPLDASTCRLIEQRFRYSPARNAAGEAMSDIKGWKQIWWTGKRG